MVSYVIDPLYTTSNTMEAAQFDSTLGGEEHLPFSANSLKFAASRSIEIAAMTESILRPSTTKLIFQCLPVHMRRRVMSHNCKRLPRKLRAGHMEQLKKSGLPPKQKRPSRKYRRRRANLLEEYNRRQKRNVWLETHIWHAKRFHMIERWGHRLAYAPCDKAFRACYRASSAHCLLQDISYYVPVQVTGTIENIKKLFSHLTDSSCGLGICAKAYTSGTREGTINLFNKNSFPSGYIGKINFIWVPGNSSNRTLWLFVHPSQRNELETILTDLLSEYHTNKSQIPEKRRKLDDMSEVKFEFLSGSFNRFRLTGPKSHAVLSHSLKSIEDLDKIKSDVWVSALKQTHHLKEKYEYWQKICSANAPSQLPPNLIVGLIVRDPRLSRPSKRTKAQPNNEQVNTEDLINFPASLSTSPLWDTNIHKVIKDRRLTNGQFIEHVTKTQLVPGEVNLEDPAIQSVPVVLIQRPGSQDPAYKKLSYGCGWDIIIPSGYGLPFWLTFIMFGGRSGGLRESESISFEMGECYLPPDSNAGKEAEKRVESELKERYFSLPPSKRVNYMKLGVNSPFICPWKILLTDWCDKVVDDFFVLRDGRLLGLLAECILKKSPIPELQNAATCLVAVYIQVQGKGNLKRHAHICLPQPGDVINIKGLFEPHYADPNEKLRKEKKKQHVKDLKKWRRRRIKLKKESTMTINKPPKQSRQEPSDYVKAMRELWIPSQIQNVRRSTCRDIMGYVSQGAFSFSEAQSCGVGYIAYTALQAFSETGLNQVLIRNTCSRKYRLANLRLVRKV